LAVMPSAGVKKTQSLAAVRAYLTQTRSRLGQWINRWILQVKSKKGAKAVKPGFSYGTMQ